MKKNTIKGIAAGAIVGAKLLISPLEIQAQNYNSGNFNNGINNGTEISVSNTPRENDVLKAYYNLEAISFQPNASRSLALRTNGGDLRNIESFLGLEDGLYNGTSAGLQMVPENGQGSIHITPNEIYGETQMIGSGYNKAKAGKFDAEVITSRDMSYTWAIYARKAGYTPDGETRNEERLKKIIMMNTGIPVSKMEVQWDANGNCKDVVYTGTDTRPEVSKMHPALGETKYATVIDTVWLDSEKALVPKPFPKVEMPVWNNDPTKRSAPYKAPCDQKIFSGDPCDPCNLPGATSETQKSSMIVEPRPYKLVKKTKVVSRGSEVNHILMVPGKTFLMPLDDLLEISGVDIEQENYFRMPDNGQPQKGARDTLVIIKEHYKPSDCESDCEDDFDYKEEWDCIACPRPKVSVDSIEQRIGLRGTSTNNKVAGIAFYSQLGKCAPWVRWDGEIGFNYMHLNGESKSFTEETLKHHTLNYEGVSQLEEKGNYDIKNYEVDLILARHFGKTNAFSLRAGVSGDFTVDKYKGKEVRTTWFNGPKNQVIDWDQTTRDVESNDDNLRFSPIIGFGIDIRQLTLSFDYHIPIQEAYNSPHAGPVNPGNFKVGVGLNFGRTRADEAYSNAAINKQTQQRIDAQNKAYRMKSKKAHYHK